MAYFPFMIEVADRLCVIAGGGHVACRKAAQMLEFGARVKIVSPEICDELSELADSSDKRLYIERRTIKEEDLSDAFVVIMATNASDVNSHMAAVCRKNKILVNVVDVKEDCGFYFPAIVKDEDVVVSVSTGGNSPLLAARLKNKIKDILPGVGYVAKELGRKRQEILDKYDEETERKKAFGELIDKYFDEIEE